MIIPEWKTLIIILTLTFSSCVGNDNEKMTLSPTPPLNALTTSLPPQQAPLPPAPNGLELKQGYFQGEDGVQLFYRIVGSGKDTIVFEHGGPIGIEDCALDIEVISKRGYTFICNDERGGGRSELVRDSTKLGINNYVADLEELRKYFNLNKLILVGDSWGAGVCSFYAFTFPNNVKCLALLSPMWTTSSDQNERFKRVYEKLGTTTSQKLEDLGKLWSSASNEQLAEIYRSIDSLYLPAYVINPANLKRTRGCIYTYSPLALRNADNQLKYSFNSLGNDFDFRPKLKLINAPTIIIEGEQTVVPKEATKQYLYNIKNSKLVWIPNAGHMFWLDQSQAALDSLDNFIKAQL